MEWLFIINRHHLYVFKRWHGGSIGTVLKDQIIIMFEAVVAEKKMLTKMRLTKRPFNMPETGIATTRVIFHEEKEKLSTLERFALFIVCSIHIQ